MTSMFVQPNLPKEQKHNDTVNEMPSYKKVHVESKLKRHRKRIHSDSSDDEPSMSSKSSKSRYHIRQLLKNYQQRQLGDVNSEALKYVPHDLKHFFTFYINHLKSINTSFDSIQRLFQSNQEKLNLDLMNNFQEIIKGTEDKFNRFTESLINHLIRDYEEDLIYNSLKASVSNPVIALEKLHDNENNGKSIPEKQKQLDIFDEFGDSDIDLQINEFFDNINDENINKAEKNEHLETIQFGKPSKNINENQFVQKRDISKDGERPKTRENFHYDSDGYLIVYTDGCCLYNGKAHAKAGIGVWFGYGNPLNVADPVEGPATNNNAEIQAASRAILLASSLGEKKVKICTDSQFLIDCMTKWIHKWKLNDWKTADFKPVKNKKSLQKLDHVMSLMESVVWKHIPSHKGQIGNESADELAKEGAKKYTVTIN